MTRLPLMIALLGLAGAAGAQSSFGGRGFPRERLELVSRFDEDGNGRLDDAEREAARKFTRSSRSGRSAAGGSNVKMALQSSLADDLSSSAASAVGDAVDLYDPDILRALYLRFPDEGWFGELSDFYNTDVEVPADLIVDGAVYESVGVRFRGN